MARTKLHTTIATLAATFSIAVAVGPMVSAAQAEDSGGGYQRTMQEYCKQMHDEFESDSADFARAFAAGDGQAANDALNSAANDYSVAVAHDCDWTVEARVPHWPVHPIATTTPVRTLR